MHLGRWILTTGSLLLAGCRGLNDGDLTEPPDGSHCPDEAPAWCDDTCVDTASDVNHCGGCGAVCEASSQVEGLTCVAGACVVTACKEGFDDCDKEHENGCEAELAVSKEHCGACGTACVTECLNGACNDPVEVSAGASYTCAIRASGSVWCWGHNEHWGNVGVTPTEPIVAVPRRVQLPVPAVAVHTGKLDVRRHTCAQLEGGAVYCWGANGNGQLGTGNTMQSSTPLPVGLSDVRQMAVGGTHTCAVTNKNQLYCWGNNDLGQIGKVDSVPQETLPTFLLNDVEDVALGEGHTCARRETLTVNCWGANTSGQVGNNSTDTVYGASPIFGLAGAASLGLGAAHSCALFEDGTLKCWGEGEDGQLGLGTTADVSTPTYLMKGDIRALAIGAASSAVVGITGEVFAWGANADGQLGLGHTDPVLALERTNLGLVKKISLGDRHGCAIRLSGELVCWGANDKGQLGRGNMEPSLVPVPVVFPPEGPGSEVESAGREGGSERDQ